MIVYLLLGRVRVRTLLEVLSTHSTSVVLLGSSFHTRYRRCFWKVIPHILQKLFCWEAVSTDGTDVVSLGSFFHR